MSNYYVFRINYEDSYRMVRDNIIKGTLRQGWGADGMYAEQSYENFRAAWHKIWGPNDAEDSYILGKWRMLQIIPEMQSGDRIIIPKLSLENANQRNYFTIATRTEDAYSFEPIKGDFGHIVPIKPIVSFTYEHNDASRTVSAKFKAYQRAINRVYAVEFCNAVEQLITEYKKNPAARLVDDQSSLEALTAPSAISDAKRAYLKQIISKINEWQPQQLEKIIEELFTKNGYTKLYSNCYDRKGGDIDLVFNCYAVNTFMSDVFSFSNNVYMPEIRIQAKNKKNQDHGDIQGVDQLIKMDGHENAINILINTTNEYSPKTVKEAAEKGVILINGINFAALLVKYGLDFFDHEPCYKNRIS